ncbi:MAG: DMT family transporter [Bdellovibrionales bacterium]|nr:DMT family transporter [Bdellovibrionales bacterium]
MSLQNITPRTKGLLAAGLTAGCWSFLAILLKLALQYGDSYTIVWYRMIVATLVLGGWMLFSGRKLEFSVLKTPPGTLLIAGLCLSANYLGFMQGVHYTSPANAQIFIQLGPLLLAISGVLIFKEQISKIQIFGFLFCVLGFGLFYLDKSSSFAGDPQNYFWGQSWILFAAVTWAVFASLQKPLFLKWKSYQINLYIYLIASVVFLPTVQWQSLWQASPWVHLLFFFLGLNTLLAYGSLSVALKNLPATQVSPIITMNPLLTLVFLWVLEQMAWNFIPPDPIKWSGYLGALLAVLGVILVISQKRKPPTPKMAR